MTVPPASSYFNVTSPGTDTGRGVAEYVTMNDLTAATCSVAVGNVNCGTGAAVTAVPEATSSSTGTPTRRARSKRHVDHQVRWRNLLNATGCASCNGTKSTPTLTADLLGDWREELVLRESTTTALRVYTTTT
jgi:rhamnogalacturonan endolyase